MPSLNVNVPSWQPDLSRRADAQSSGNDVGWRLHDQDPSALGVGLPANLQLLLQPALLFVVSATIFVVLKSTDFLAVDGGLRPLEIYHNQTFFLSGNEHLLYPLDVYLWSRLLQCFGFAARTPIEFLAITQAMNAFAAAGCVTIMFIWCRRITSQRFVPFAISIAYGSSRAFLAHATNAAEPMVGLFWSFLAAMLVAASLSREKRLLCFAGGVILALSMATYMSMVLIGPSLCLLIWKWPPSPVQRVSRATQLASFLSGCILGAIVIYGTAYYLSGTRDIVSMLHRLGAYLPKGYGEESVL